MENDSSLLEYIVKNKVKASIEGEHSGDKDNKANFPAEVDEAIESVRVRPVSVETVPQKISPEAAGQNTINDLMVKKKLPVVVGKITYTGK